MFLATYLISFNITWCVCFLFNILLGILKRQTRNQEFEFHFIAFVSLGYMYVYRLFKQTRSSFAGQILDGFRSPSKTVEHVTRNRQLAFTL